MSANGKPYEIVLRLGVYADGYDGARAVGKLLGEELHERRVSVDGKLSQRVVLHDLRVERPGAVRP